MQLLSTFALVGSLALTASAAGQDAFDRAAAVKNRVGEKQRAAQQSALDKRQDNGTSPYLTPASEKFVVNGTSIPLVNFDIGESYAGLLPISSDPNDTRQLYFWFFPSQNPDAGEEIAVWVCVHISSIHESTRFH